MSYWKCCEIEADVSESAVLVRIDGFITNKRQAESIITHLREAIDKAFPEPCRDKPGETNDRGNEK